jgi:glycosyl transferase family 2
MAAASGGAAPLVSIIVRSMARASLADALASIATQDHPRIEVVLVAACGATHPVPSALIGPHAVRYVPGAVARTRPQAANAGLDAASGEWITFLDDDDRLLPAHVRGLVEAARAAGSARVVYTLAQASMRDGRSVTWGQPFALHELHERNFIHLSTALVSRELVRDGCRFDETLDIMEDWDFFLQCAQRTRFHFEPRRTFQWNAEAGDSGASAGANQNDARFAAFRERVYAKWARPFDALVDASTAAIQAAGERAKAGDLRGAEAACRAALETSQNDPFVLNMLAMVQRAAGRIDDARATQTLACAVRPHDASLARNLALLDRTPRADPGVKPHAEA